MAKKTEKPKRTPADYDRFGGVVGVKVISKPKPQKPAKKGK